MEIAQRVRMRRLVNVTGMNRHLSKNPGLSPDCPQIITLVHHSEAFLFPEWHGGVLSIAKVPFSIHNDDIVSKCDR